MQRSLWRMLVTSWAPSLWRKTQEEVGPRGWICVKCNINRQLKQNWYIGEIIWQLIQPPDKEPTNLFFFLFFFFFVFLKVYPEYFCVSWNEMSFWRTKQSLFCPLLTIWTSGPLFHSVLEPRSPHLLLQQVQKETPEQGAGGSIWSWWGGRGGVNADGGQGFMKLVRDMVIYKTE